MESMAKALGAFSAQKLPTQKQINAWIDFLIRQVDQVSTVPKESGSACLSEYGSKLANDFKQLLIAHKELGSSKNGDDILQSALYNLSQGELKTDPSAVMAQHEAVTDIQHASAALKHILLVLWGHLSSPSGAAGDFASFTRKFLADTAEVVEQHADAVKSNLRETEEEVQQGKRDPLGRSREDKESDNLQEQYERTMDTAKVTGSQAIGAGQAVKQKGDELRRSATQDLNKLFDKASNFIISMLERAQNDPEYRDSVSTILNLGSKWFNRTVDAADKTSVDEFIYDPTGRIPSALESLNTFIERFAGGKSTIDIKIAFRAAAQDIRNDPELLDYFNQVHDFVRRSISEPTYSRSAEHDQHRKELRDRWHKLQSGEERGKWNDDLERLQNEVCQFFDNIQNDQDVKRLQEASAIFANDLSEAMISLNEATTGNANWLWQDIADVCIPRAVKVLKDIPIPRTECKDENSEFAFVVENLKLEKLNLLPGRGHIRNTTDMDISKASSEAEGSIKVKSYTQLHFKGVELKVKDVPFWYRDPALQPMSEVSGLLSIEVPEEGVDVDISLGLISQAEKKASGAGRRAFFTVDRVNVKLNNPSLTIRQSNHPILLTALKPIFSRQLVHTIESTLAEQITVPIQCMDAIAFDIRRRAEVFRDTGMNPSASFMSAIWSEIGHLKREPGIFSGLQTTSVGVVLDDPRTTAKFAVGAQPQIISGEKHGPEVPGSYAQAKRDQATRLAAEAKGRALGEGERVDSGAVSFSQEVKFKKEVEEKISGWRSDAFDVPRL
ncbi:hypothetical protein BU17DRAFT_81736 [Hysterangium stoloniferum]|nr:hypothetical protein BU17DRAFT_81736 [Hysterangium stoloniferum]